MDTFMDKLAQKLTAQEMIKANAAADAEEMTRLQNQVKEYNDCLIQMRQVNQEMQARAEHLNQDIQAKAEQMNRDIQTRTENMGQEMEIRTEKLSQEMQAQTGKMTQEMQIQLEKVNQEMQTAAVKLDQELKGASRKLDQFMEVTLNPQVTKLVEEGVARLKGASVDGDQLNRLIEESIGKIREIQQDGDGVEKLRKVLGEMLEQSNEFVHKENVKVYRNVQAVVLEESVKISDCVKGETKNMSGRMNLIFGISIGALAASLGGLIFQLLTFFKIV